MSITLPEIVDVGIFVSDMWSYYKKNKNISVMMPYSSRLKYVSDWYVQLLAESLGKELNKNQEKVNIGLTPVKALGATDQHSLMQLFYEGPNDKLITFIRVKIFPLPLFSVL